MGKKKSKMKIGTVKATDLLKATRGTYTPTFRSGAFETKKDKPRDKNWKKWV